MRVLIVSNMYPDKKNPSYGIFVARFCSQLDRLGILYNRVVMHKGTYKIDKIIKYLLFYCNSFLKCLLGNYDVIYVHYASHSSLSVLAANRLKKLKIVVNVHGSDIVPENDKQEKMQKYTKGILQVSSLVVAPSEYFRQYLHQKYAYPLDKILVYPSGGVDPNTFYFADERKKLEYIKEFGLSANKIRIGYIGRISPGKGWGCFVKAVSSILKEEFDFEKTELLAKLKFEFLMVGDGIEESALQKQIINLELQDQILRYPLLSQGMLAKMYNCLDVFVFPTEREGESLGLVALEAMACGALVITSDYAALQFIIKNGQNGFKYPKGDVEALKDLILKIATLPEERVKFIETNAGQTVDKYYEDNILTQLKEIFRRIANV